MSRTQLCWASMQCTSTQCMMLTLFLHATAALHMQTQLQETQRLKQVVDMECQKATAAAMHAKALEAQLAATTTAVQEAQRAQFELQQQVHFSLAAANAHSLA